MLTPIPNNLKAVITRNNGLRQYLESLPRNKAYTDRSWLYDGHNGGIKMSPDQILEKWCAILDAKLKDGDPSSRMVWEFDTSQKQKWGPQGGHEPIADLMNDIVLPSFQMGASATEPPAFNDPDWARAIQLVVKAYKQRRVHGLLPRSFENVVDYLRVDGKLETNSGWPDFTRRQIPAVRAAAIRAARDGSWKTYPAIALFRRYNGKTRLVWMYPMATNIVEASFVQPLMDAISRTDLVEYFFSPWKGFGQVRKRITEVYNSGRFVAASDFTSTDAHFQKQASAQVLKVLTELFHPSCRAELEESVMHMHTIPLVIGLDKMLVGDHGVSSGSNWTNLIETIFDNILGYFVMLKQQRVQGLYGIGDDMAWVTSSKEVLAQLPQILELAGKSVGQVIKSEKTTADENKVKSLQRLFIRGYRRPDGLLRGVYSTIRALKSSVYPEREHWDWTESDFCVRQFQILENCVDHPLFEEFVAFVVAGSEHLRPFAKQPAEYLRAAQRKAGRIPGLNPTYNQEKKESSLEQFESIRIAKSL